jgi:hypothetical protein
MTGAKSTILPSIYLGPLSGGRKDTVVTKAKMFVELSHQAAHLLAAHP